MAVLLALPPGVRWLELDVLPCAGPLLPALARFRHLEELTIGGNGADICWGVGPAAVLAPLRALCLDYRQQEDSLPSSTQRALAAATALHSLELRVYWNDQVVQLCCALPGLRSLR